MKRFINLFFIFLLLSPLLKAQNKWELIRNENNIKVYSRENGDKYEIKSITTVQSNFHSIVAVMQDVGNFDQWLHAARKSVLIKKYSDTKFMYYLQSNVPWPASDRDMVIILKISIADDKKHVYSNSQSIEGVIKEKDDFVRVKYMQAAWKFTDLENGNIHVVYKVSVKPQTNLPDWLLEEIYEIAPFETIQNFRKIVQSDKYKNAVVNILE